MAQIMEYHSVLINYCCPNPVHGGCGFTMAHGWRSLRRMIDLHSHTWFSDGQLSPAQLLTRAAELGLTHLAITDHDSIAAHRVAEPVPSGLELIAGVEISTLWENKEVHIVGLMIDISSPELTLLLDQQQQKRRERALNIGRQLERAGICGLANYLSQLPCEAVGRNHIADFLISTGRAASKQQAFTKHLGHRGRYHEPADWCSIGDAVQAIKTAGGVAVVAHPDRYKLNKIKLKRLFEEFRDAGGEAIEVSYSNLHPEKLQLLANYCVSLGLRASIGSDFHSPDNTWMDLGRIRRLPSQCEEQAIWTHPRWIEHHRPHTQAGQLNGA
jgi:3',5'-nucleoside bisphosphate phosphatase